MKKKHLVYAILPIMVFALFGAKFASACGWGGFFGFGNADPEKVIERQQAAFQNQAQILGIGLEEIKNYWAEGKNIEEIIEEKGISQEEIETRMRELRLQGMKSFLQSLIDQGVISQAQADKRLEFMQNRFEDDGIGRMGKGLRMGRGFGRGFGW